MTLMLVFMRTTWWCVHMICLGLALRLLPPPCAGLYSTWQSTLKFRVTPHSCVQERRWLAKIGANLNYMYCVYFLQLEANLFFPYLLCCCKEKVQAEINRVIGQSRQPSMEDRANMPYTDAVIHEIQRMGNIVPLSLPHITSQKLQLGGYTVPEVIFMFDLVLSKYTHYSLFS